MSRIGGLADLAQSAYCSDGIPVAVQNGGTLTFLAFRCPGQIQMSVLNGAGTWDYSGNLQFVLHLFLSSYMGLEFIDYTFTSTLHRQP